MDAYKSVSNVPNNIRPLDQLLMIVPDRDMYKAINDQLQPGVNVNDVLSGYGEMNAEEWRSVAIYYGNQPEPEPEPEPVNREPVYIPQESLKYFKAESDGVYVLKKQVFRSILWTLCAIFVAVGAFVLDIYVSRYALLVGIAAIIVAIYFPLDLFINKTKFDTNTRIISNLFQKFTFDDFSQYIHYTRTRNGIPYVNQLKVEFSSTSRRLTVWDLSNVTAEKVKSALIEEISTVMGRR